jgi:hypothetical protein
MPVLCAEIERPLSIEVLGRKIEHFSGRNLSATR